MPGKKRTWSPETREKMRQSALKRWRENPESHWLLQNPDHPSRKKLGFQGPHTEETKQKISQNRKGKGLGNKSAVGHTPHNKGKPHNVHDASWRKRVSEANSGENHWNWKGGISSENRLMRNSTAHKNWMHSVFRRDKWTCQKCGYRGKDIVAHHITPWAESKKLRFVVSNGVTYCRACHCAYHTPRLGTGKPPKPHFS